MAGLRFFRSDRTVRSGFQNLAAIQTAWGLNFQASRNIAQGISSFSNLVGLVELQHENLELFVVVAWFIWLSRNKNRVNEPCILVGKIYEAAQSILTDYQTKATLKYPVAIPTRVKWKSPISDFYKANYNGALLKDSSEAGLGVVIRNEKGEVMGSLVEKITKPDSVEVLEALAAR